MGGSLLFKAEVLGSNLLDHLLKEFFLRFTWCLWLVGYYGTQEISRGVRKLARTPSLSKKKKVTFRLKTLICDNQRLFITICDFFYRGRHV